jgi:ribonuclease HI
VLAACSPSPGCIDAEEAEALGALSGIKLLTDRGHDKIILEVDAANVAKALRSSVQDRSKQWATFEEAKTLLASFAHHRVSHIPRESNRVADSLAKMGRSAASCIWLDRFPDNVLDLVTQDLNSRVAMIISLHI